MHKILTFTIIFLLSINQSLAQCGRHAEVKVETRQRSSVNISQGTHDVDEVAKVTQKEAKKIATTQYPGKVKVAKLIIEDGAIAWKIEVKGKEGQKEMFIDPANGTFLGYGLTK